ncbi:MAG: ComEC/Rec2 family competence protein [Candidatus Paceibacterota bacterium]|jgi:competence protein ComEC
MRLYDIFFFAAVFFLIGIFLASFGLSFSIIVIATFFSVAIFLFLGYFKKNNRRIWVAGLLIFVIIGSFYYLWDDKKFQKTNLIFDQKTSFSGVVVAVDRGASQKVTVNLQGPQKGLMLIMAKSYPSFNYGDLISFEGVAKKTDDSSYGNYLRKNRIIGATDYPQITLIKSDQGNLIKAKLLVFKDKTIEVFQRILPSEKAAFLSGLTLGEKGEFSKTFKDVMSKSGTTHLVALSGYNISIIITLIFGIFLFSFNIGKRWAFVFSVIFVLLFVMMTGGEASVVRAAVMGIIALLAKEVGRIHSFRNAIIFAAFLMILGNPKLLTFDVGFQLSFLAVIGLVYLSPIIKNLLHFKEESAFDWQDNFSSTLSAQIMVAPLLISYFSNFSFISLIANLLILSVIPLTMALGFLGALVGFIFFPLAIIFGWFLNIFLSYEVFLIKFFGNMNFFNISSISFSLAVIYYVILVAFMIFYGKKLREQKVYVQE